MYFGLLYVFTFEYIFFFYFLLLSYTIYIYTVLVDDTGDGETPQPPMNNSIVKHVRLEFRCFQISLTTTFLCYVSREIDKGVDLYSQ